MDIFHKSSLSHESNLFFSEPIEIIDSRLYINNLSLPVQTEKKDKNDEECFIYSFDLFEKSDSIGIMVMNKISGFLHVLLYRCCTIFIL